MNVNQKIDLNLSASGLPPTLKMAQYDANSRTIVATLWNGASKFVIPSNASVMVRFGKPDGTGGLYDETEAGDAITFADNVVTAPVAAQMLSAAGAVKANIEIYQTGETEQAAVKLATFYFVVNVERSAHPDADMISSDYYNIIAAQITKAVQAGEKADAAINAATAATAAAAAAANAKTAAESAKASAQGFASQAETSAQNALQDAKDAEAWAVGKRGGVNVDETDPTYNNNAKYYAEHSGGSGYTVRGFYPSVDALRQAHPTGNAGDAWRVGTAEDNTTYVWDVDTEDWVDIGTGGSGISQDALDAKQDKIMANGFLRGDGAGNVTADKPAYIVPISISGNTATITSDDTYVNLYEKLRAGYTVMLQKETTTPFVNYQTMGDYDWYVCNGYSLNIWSTAQRMQYAFSFYRLAGDNLITLSTKLPSTIENNAEQNTFTVSTRQIGTNPTMTLETLPAADWDSSDKSQVLAVSGVWDYELDQVIIVSPHTDSQSAYYAAGVRCVGQDTDQLTFRCDTIPDADLDIFVSI